MGARDHEQAARRGLAAIAFVVCLVGCLAMVGSLRNLSWSEYSQVDGSGHFGIWRYEFSIRNVSRSGDIQSHDDSALCNLDYYNVSRTVAKEHDNVPGKWKDDCDDMIDACGLAKNLGILAGVCALAAAAFSCVSAVLHNDVVMFNQGQPTVALRKYCCPSYSTAALVFSCASAGFATLAVLAYATERPSTPNRFLKDYDTPGAQRTWSLGHGFYLMLGAALVMFAGSLLLVTVRNSKKIFLTSRPEISSMLLSETEDRHWDEVEEQKHDAAGPAMHPL
jgi:hypothetical protein